MLEKGIDFAVNVAPQIFTATGKDVNKLKKMKDRDGDYISIRWFRGR